MKERLKKVPLKPGVYIYKDRDGEVIYVGKARLLRNRMRSYFQAGDKLHPKVRAMMMRVDDFDFIVTRTEVEALILENNLIKAYKPRYNIDLRDDKTYPYLKITAGEKYPRICLVREEKDGVSRYFGPYTDVTSLRETLKILRGVFPLRTCKTLPSKGRACLNRDLNKCLAPCTGEVNEATYQQIVNDLIKFLEGNSHEMLHNMEKEMKAAAENLEFEKAARLRDQIQAISKINDKQKINLASPYNLDLVGMLAGEKENLVLVFRIRSGRIVGKDTFWLNRPTNEDESELMEFFLKQYYSENQDIPKEVLLSNLPADLELVEEWLRSKTGQRVELRVPLRGDKKNTMDLLLNNARLLWEEKNTQENRNNKILVDLSKVLNLEVLPERIECFDISHLGGEETVASMVVFTVGQPDKKAYRRFKIRTQQNNDTASLAETIRRRFENAREGNPAFLPEPDLVMVDGGLGQVNTVQRVLDEMQVDIPLISLAKKNEEIFRAGSSHPLTLPRRDEGLKLLQRLRDEAHRFAIEYNRKRRAGKMRASALDEIDGIGTARKKKLLTYFGSVAKIKEAAMEDLAAVPGMNRTAARNVYEYFQKQINLGK